MNILKRLIKYRFSHIIHRMFQSTLPRGDGGFSGGTLERPALKELFQDIAEGKVDTVVVYKIDRLTRSLMDFSKIVNKFDNVNHYPLSLKLIINLLIYLGIKLYYFLC